MYRYLPFRHVRLILLLSVFQTALISQTTGVILGQVTDPSGAVVSGAQVTATNIADGYSRTFKTDQSGDYLMPAMPVGNYSITAVANGFSSVKKMGGELTVNQNMRVDLTLAIGQASQVVEVQGTASQVDTLEASIGSLMDQKRLVDLPLNGRNPAALIALVPGANSVSVPTRPSISGVVVRMGGTNGTGQEYTLDGAPFNALQRSDGLPLPPPDVVEEFRVQTSNYSAEYGRNAGGVISTITKSGTNDLHASAWEYLRNDKLDARGFFDPSTPKLRQNQFGFTVGGPVFFPKIYNGHNKTFFFASYQGTRIREEVLANTATTPNAAERNGNFSQDAVKPVDPLTNQPFANGMIPASRFDPAALKVLARIPVPNSPDGRFISEYPQPTNGNQVFVRMDHAFSDKNRLSVKYWNDKGAITDALPSSSNFQWSQGQFNLTIYNASINDTHIFTPNLINQLTIGLNRRDEERFNTTKADVTNLGIAIAPPAEPFLPTVTVTGRLTAGVEINGQPTKLDNVVSTSDQASWIHGAHNIKFGASREGSRFEGSPFFDNGSFTFSGQVTGNAVADLLIGKPIQFTDLKGRIDDDMLAYWGMFVQDDYKITKRLTLNLGLRYQYDSRIYQRQKHESNYIPGFRSIVYPQAPLGLAFPGDPGVDRSLYNPDKNNFAPRIGFAYDVFGNGKTSVRGGFGIFYQALDLEFANYLGSNPPFTTSVVLNNPYSLSDPWHGLYQGGVNDPISTYNPNPSSAKFIPPFTLYSVDPNIRNGYVEQYSLSIQQQLSRDLVMQVAYAGNSGRKLTLAVQGNPAIPGPGATTANTDARRTYMPGTYSGITGFHDENNSEYNSLQISANKRFSHDFTFSLAYTWSHTINFYDAEAVSASVNDPYNLNTDRGPASYDLRHNFTASVVWQPSAFHQSPNWFLRDVVHGWEFAALPTLHTGFPISIVTGRDNSLTGVNSDRPDVTGNPVLSSSRSKAQLVAEWFNIAAFTANGPGDFGTLGRNALVGPGFWNVDFSLMRNFRIAEHNQLQFRSEFFNGFNHANFNNPTATYYSSTFGRILSASPPRLIQFALRYSF